MKHREQVHCHSAETNPTNYTFHPNEIHNMLTTSWIVILLVLSASSFTRSTFSSVLLVDGVRHLQHRSHNLWTPQNHSKICVLPTVCSPKATLNTAILKYNHINCSQTFKIHWNVFRTQYQSNHTKFWFHLHQIACKRFPQNFHFTWCKPCNINL